MDREIAEFGRLIGLENLALPAAGPLGLDIERIGRLYLERNEGELLVYLALPLPAYESRRLLSAFELVAYENAPDFAWVPGVHDERLLLMSRLPLPAVQAATLKRLMEFLLEISRQL